MPAAGHGKVQVRPQRRYRSQFRALVQSFHPRSVLDVGCGRGEALRELAAAGILVCGVEPGGRFWSAAGNDRVTVVAGVAEALPFPDRCFDVVISEYSAHHFADFGAYIREAERVARRAHLVLDAWYDTRLPSQQSAQALDEWMKALDRVEGQLHHDVIHGERFLAESLRRAELGLTTWLEVVPLDLERVLAEIGARLGSPALTTELRERAALLIAELRQHPPTDDGAIVFTALY